MPWSTSLLLEECGLPARMAARMAALPGGKPLYPDYVFAELYRSGPIYRLSLKVH